ncbi:MAG: DUF2075 domain-containing protein [Prevotellaceae bacterium]|jgi:hypothetical protein|nr:DUF2075 domain-containing protein [Prevotellaceae bacterium]
MSKLIQEITAFKQRATEHLQQKGNNAFMQIMQQNSNYEKFIAADIAAMADWEKLTDLKAPKHMTIPPILRFGYLIASAQSGKPLDKVPIPLLLPSAESNAVLFDAEHLKADAVPAIFQSIALRFLLSMPMKVSKFYFVDSNFGNNFSFFYTISNSMLQRELFFRQEDINKMLFDLGKTVNQASQNYLGTYPNLTAYNKQAGQMAQPYHFVFIDDFPNGFSTNTLDTLYNLIRNGNAVKAGIHIFINYSVKNNAPRDFDINRFKTICSCISSNTKGDVSLTNWNVKISLPQYKIVIETALPKKAGKIVDFINNMEEDKVTFSLDGWIDDQKKNRQIWKDTTSNGIKVPVGFVSPTEMFNFYIANDNDSNCNDFFALVAGRPGYGKTVLLHNIIVNACMKYSPDELQIYLADFAEGASFSIYRDLPHAKALMLSNNKEYALRMLEHIVAEAKHRSHLYQQAQKKYGQQVTTLASYRKITGEKLPRILILMDEFHFLFNSVDMVSIRAREELINGIRQWRKFGISIVLCTQSISGVNFGNAADFITYRFALNLLEMDSKTVIRNSAAKSLTRKGQTIMNNTADGNEQMNIEFQCAFTTKYLEYTNWLAQVYRKNVGELPIRYICESGTDADIADNAALLQQFEKDRFTVNHNYCDVFVGKPDLLRDSHTRIRYRRQQNSNTLIIGEDFGTAINNIAVSLIQMQKQSAPNSKFYVMDCFNAGDEFQGALNGITDYSPNFVLSNAQSIADCVNTLTDELEKRKQAQTQQQNTEERIVLSVLNIQNCYALKAESIMKPSETATKLAKIFSEGAPLGMHCIIHSLNYSSMFGQSGLFKSDIFNFFENKIFLKGADVKNMLLGGIKIEAVEENGLMIVLNNKMDGENYEQCKSYSEITAKKTNTVIDFISQLFNCNRYA